MLTILDVKRGDVATTNAAYAEAFLGQGAPFESDALTVHPYLGIGAMDAFVARAHQAAGCLLVVTRSSNAEGRAVQAARSAGGQTVEQRLLLDIKELNAVLAPGEIGPVGAVIGPTHLEPALDLAAANALFLAPGLGTQGASCADVARIFAACPDRVMPSASRSLLAAGPDKSALQVAVRALAEELRSALPDPFPVPSGSPG